MLASQFCHKGFIHANKRLFDIIFILNLFYAFFETSYFATIFLQRCSKFIFCDSTGKSCSVKFVRTLFVISLHFSVNKIQVANRILNKLFKFYIFSQSVFGFQALLIVPGNIISANGIIFRAVRSGRVFGNSVHQRTSFIAALEVVQIYIFKLNSSVADDIYPGIEYFRQIANIALSVYRGFVNHLHQEMIGVALINNRTIYIDNPTRIYRLFASTSHQIKAFLIH